MPYSEQVLRKKHGFTDPHANYEVERTEQYIIARIKEMGLHNIKNPLAREHFRRKIAFHERFYTQESYVK